MLSNALSTFFDIESPENLVLGLIAGEESGRHVAVEVLGQHRVGEPI